MGSRRRAVAPDGHRRAIAERLMKASLVVEGERDLHTAFPDALLPQVPGVAGIERRANAPAEQIDEAFPIGPIHIIAHSMGGLDSRYIHVIEVQFRRRHCQTNFSGRLWLW